MNLQLVKFNAGNKRKGSFFTVVYERNMATYKNNPVTVTKRTKMAGVRLGVNYAHLKAVKEQRLAQGLDLDTYVEKLPWGKWAEGCFPYIIENNGKNYLRVTPTKNTRYTEQYFVQGVEVTREKALSYCMASEQDKSHKEKSIVMTIGIENIITVK